jgi:glyceraldehyde-3-phosphate dehydrogenase/erythrose-4-phosphate dehydrogenase
LTRERFITKLFKKPIKLTVMKTISTIILVMSFITATAQTNLEGIWFTENSETTQTIKFNKGEVLIHQIDKNDQISIFEGHYYYEVGSDLLVIIQWYGNEASTLKYTFKAEGEQLELNQFYPSQSSAIFDKGPSLADL